MVPEGQKMAASMPNILADSASTLLVDGSSPKTSSPTFAVIIASSIPGEGLVTVSDLRSMTIYRICSEGIPPGLQYNQFTPQLMQLANNRSFYAFHLLIWCLL